MDFEFETKRTALANAFADAGAELLGYLAITDTVVAAIPDTQPQKYAVAGTLKGILSMAGKMMGEDGVTGLEGLTGEALLREIFTRPDLPEYSREAEIRYVMSEEGEIIVTRSDFDAMAEFAKRFVASSQDVSAVSQPTGDLTDEPLTIALGQGLIEVGQGHHGDARLPAILFGRNGAGSVGIETEGDRVMKPGECIAAITFENPQSLDVVAEKLGELRARIWPDAEPLPAKHVIAPHFRGYAHLGIGAYVLNHSAAGEVPELGISIATEEQKAGRAVGDLRDNEPGELVHAKDIAVRLRFANVAGLDALEQQLSFVRSVHFPESASHEGAHAGTPRVDALMTKWDDDGATRGSAFIELRDLARELERSAAPVAPAGAQIPAVIREAVEAAFEDREDWRTKIASAVRALGDAGAQNAEAIRNQWISVDERLPETEVDVIVHAFVRGFGSHYAVAGLFHDDWLANDTERELRFTPTHWMPLPDAPALQTGSANTQEGGDHASE